MHQKGKYRFHGPKARDRAQVLLIILLVELRFECGMSVLLQ